MKSRKELKQEAKDALSGRWGGAILMTVVPGIIVVLITWILMALTSVPFVFTSAVSEMIADSSNSAEMSLATFATMAPMMGTYTLITIAASLIQIVLQSGVNFTYLDALRGRREEPYRVADAFRCFRFPYLLGLIVVFILVSIFSYLWTLLLIIPGIIKFYSYSQSYFIYYDIHEGTGEKPKALECITASRRLMDGYKWKLFVLDLSFIGWGILASITVIGLLWFIPYYQATRAAFTMHYQTKPLRFKLHAYYKGTMTLVASLSYEPNNTKRETQAKEGYLPLNSLEDSLLFIAKNFKR